jgi:hypothetical protein
VLLGCIVEIYLEMPKDGQERPKHNKVSVNTNLKNKVMLTDILYIILK